MDYSGLAALPTEGEHMNLKGWRERKRRQLFGNEAVLLPVWSWRTLALSILYPKKGVAFYGHIFRRWACLPGDAFEDFQRNQTVIVREVKPDHIDAHVVANELLARPLPSGQPVLCLQRFPRKGYPTDGWIKADPCRAERARELTTS